MPTESSSELPPGDPKLVANIVGFLKREGTFDKFRKDFLADIDTKPAFQNLQQKVVAYVSNFLKEQKWRPDLNKNQLRNNLRQQINESHMLSSGMDRIVDQVINPNISQVVRPEIAKSVYDFLGVEPPKPREQKVTSSHNVGMGMVGPQGYLPYNFAMYPGATGAMFPGAKALTDALLGMECPAPLPSEPPPPGDLPAPPPEPPPDHEPPPLPPEDEIAPPPIEPLSPVRSSEIIVEDQSGFGPRDPTLDMTEAEPMDLVDSNSSQSSGQASPAIGFNNVGDDLWDIPLPTGAPTPEKLPPDNRAFSVTESTLQLTEAVGTETEDDGSNQSDDVTVSSVHTSDLSDFDEEISLSSDDVEFLMQTSQEEEVNEEEPEKSDGGQREQEAESQEPNNEQLMKERQKPKDDSTDETVSEPCRDTPTTPVKVRQGYLNEQDGTGSMEAVKVPKTPKKELLKEQKLAEKKTAVRRARCRNRRAITERFLVDLISPLEAAKRKAGTAPADSSVEGSSIRHVGFLTLTTRELKTRINHYLLNPPDGAPIIHKLMKKKVRPAARSPDSCGPVGGAAVVGKDLRSTSLAAQRKAAVVAEHGQQTTVGEEVYRSDGATPTQDEFVDVGQPQTADPEAAGLQYEVSADDLQCEAGEEVVGYETTTFDPGSGRDGSPDASSSHNPNPHASAVASKDGRRSTSDAEDDQGAPARLVSASDAERRATTGSGEDTDAMVEREIEKGLQGAPPKSPTDEIGQKIQQQMALEAWRTPTKKVGGGVPGNPYSVGISPIAERLAAAVPRRRRREAADSSEKREAKPRAYRSPTPYSEISDQDQFSEISSGGLSGVLSNSDSDVGEEKRKKERRSDSVSSSSASTHLSKKRRKKEKHRRQAAETQPASGHRKSKKRRRKASAATVSTATRSKRKRQRRPESSDDETPRSSKRRVRLGSDSGEMLTSGSEAEEAEAGSETSSSSSSSAGRRLQSRSSSSKGKRGRPRRRAAIASSSGEKPGRKRRRSEAPSDGEVVSSETADSSAGSARGRSRAKGEESISSASSISVGRSRPDRFPPGRVSRQRPQPAPHEVSHHQTAKVWEKLGAEEISEGEISASSASSESSREAQQRGKSRKNRSKLSAVEHKTTSVRGDRHTASKKNVEDKASPISSASSDQESRAKLPAPDRIEDMASPVSSDDALGEHRDEGVTTITSSHTLQTTQATNAVSGVRRQRTPSDEGEIVDEDDDDSEDLADQASPISSEGMDEFADEQSTPADLPVPLPASLTRQAQIERQISETLSYVKQQYPVEDTSRPTMTEKQTHIRETRRPPLLEHGALNLRQPILTSYEEVKLPDSTVEPARDSPDEKEAYHARVKQSRTPSEEGEISDEDISAEASPISSGGLDDQDAVTEEIHAVADQSKSLMTASVADTAPPGVTGTADDAASPISSDSSLDGFETVGDEAGPPGDTRTVPREAADAYVGASIADDASPVSSVSMEELEDEKEAESATIEYDTSHREKQPVGTTLEMGLRSVATSQQLEQRGGSSPASGQKVLTSISGHVDVEVHKPDARTQQKAMETSDLEAISSDSDSMEVAEASEEKEGKACNEGEVTMETASVISSVESRDGADDVISSPDEGEIQDSPPASRQRRERRRPRKWSPSDVGSHDDLSTQQTGSTCKPDAHQISAQSPMQNQVIEEVDSTVKGHRVVAPLQRRRGGVRSQESVEDSAVPERRARRRVSMPAYLQEHYVGSLTKKPRQ